MTSEISATHTDLWVLRDRTNEIARISMDERRYSPQFAPEEGLPVRFVLAGESLYWANTHGFLVQGRESTGIPSSGAVGSMRGLYWKVDSGYAFGFREGNAKISTKVAVKDLLPAPKHQWSPILSLGAGLNAVYLSISDGGNNMVWEVRPDRTSLLIENIPDIEPLQMVTNERQLFWHRNQTLYTFDFTTRQTTSRDILPANRGFKAGLTALYWLYVDEKSGDSVVMTLRYPRP